MNNHQHTIRLSKRDREQLKSITRKGKHNARVIKRAHILLFSEKGMAKDALAARLAVGRSTVQRVRDRYVDEGMEGALYDRARTGQPPLLDTQGEAHLIALACSDAPEGHARWTLKLLQEKMVEDGKVKRISDVTILNYLTKQGTKPWVEKNVVHTRSDSRIHRADGESSDSVRKTIRPK